MELFALQKEGDISSDPVEGRDFHEMFTMELVSMELSDLQKKMNEGEKGSDPVEEREIDAILEKGGQGGSPELLTDDAGVGEQDKGFWIPSLEGGKETAKKSMISEVTESSKSCDKTSIDSGGLVPCSKFFEAQRDIDVRQLDTMSNGEEEDLGSTISDSEVWTQGNKKRGKKKPQLRATRHSSRLRGHGGQSVAEMATKRKQVQNLELPGNKSKNSLAILNDIDDVVLIKYAQDLGVHLDDSLEGSKEVISAMKAEEQLRAKVAEAAYQAHLDHLKHKECIQGEVLDLSIIDNSQRDVVDSLDSTNGKKVTSNRNQGGTGKKRNESFVLEHKGF
jgi:hypothetical protein